MNLKTLWKRLCEQNFRTKVEVLFAVLQIFATILLGWLAYSANQRANTISDQQLNLQAQINELTIRSIDQATIPALEVSMGSWKDTSEWGIPQGLILKNIGSDTAWALTVLVTPVIVSDDAIYHSRYSLSPAYLMKFGIEYGYFGSLDSIPPFKDMRVVVKNIPNEFCEIAKLLSAEVLYRCVIGHWSRVPSMHVVDTIYFYAGFYNVVGPASQMIRALSIEDSIFVAIRKLEQTLKVGKVEYFPYSHTTLRKYIYLCFNPSPNYDIGADFPWSYSDTLWLIGGRLVKGDPRWK